MASFFIIFNKSVLTPTRVIEYLGFTIPSDILLFTIPEKKTQKILKLIENNLKRGRMPIGQFSSLIGKLAATLPGNDKAAVLIKKLQITKVEALMLNRGDYEAAMTLNSDTKAQLREWAWHLPAARRSYMEKEVQLNVFTDASKTGWGSYLVETRKEYGEEWCESVSPEHINVLELKAIHMALKHNSKTLTGKHLMLHIDNTTAIRCLDKGGSTSSRQCNHHAELVHRYAWNREITFVTRYCPTKLNIRADRTSRAFSTSGEWTLNPILAEYIFAQLGKPDIDLFASANNALCNTYASYRYECKAMFTDAFSKCWKDLNAHMFPPFSLIARTIRKIKADCCSGVLVVPDWPTQPWFPMISKLQSRGKHLRIPIVEGTLRWPTRPRLQFPMTNKCSLLCIKI